MSGDLSNVRNIGIAAHIDAGKTTTTERILYYAGRTHRMGEVDEGTTTTDYDEQEQRRGITIYSAAVSFEWRNCRINLIDTPGHVDFTAEVERSLRVLDGMVAVFDAREGVEAQSETVWRQADHYKVPRICFINKMDRTGADFEHAVQSLRDRLHARPLVVQLPIGAAESFQGIIDIIEQKAFHFESAQLGAVITERPMTDAEQEATSQARHDLLEEVSEFSEALMVKYLNDDPITPEEIRGAIRKATLSRAAVPVLCGSALRYVGVQRLLDAVADYLPSPLEVPPVDAHDPKKPDVTHTLHCDPSEPLSALVFKIIAEKPVDLYFLRIYSGKLKSNTRVLNASTGEKENVSRIYRMFAKRRDQLDEAPAGEIVAVIGPRHALTGQTFCDQRRPVLLESITFPDTVLSVSVEPKSSRDRDRLIESLKALTRQDPTIQVISNPETGQLLLSGMGELHLEIMVHRLRNDMNVDVSVGKPRVAYRETVTTSGEGTATFSRQLGGKEQFAEVRLGIEPWKPSEGGPSFQIQSRLPAGQIEDEFVQALKTGIADASHSGTLGGYPLINWKVTLLDARQDPANSSEMAFEAAGRMAFFEAIAAAKPVLLEPIMAVEVVTSEEYLGAIMGDLNARHATVRESTMDGPKRIIRADVSLAEMFGYVTVLRSLSQGRATSSMSPSHYAPVAPEQMKALVG
ncbi:MAG: elongation factor G [Phycisphaerae bacterium]|nr:elongation factor G [Phycisphaerae bacterium]